MFTFQKAPRRIAAEPRHFSSLVIFTMLLAALAGPVLAQPGALFYRTDYPLNYSVLGEQPAVVIADLNNDGKLDVVMGGGSGIAVALGNGDGTFRSFATFVPTGGGVNGSSILASSAADFDGDGNIDLALYAGGLGSSAGVVILLGNGDGTFRSGYQVTFQGGFLPPVPNLKLLDVADFNHDGRPDMVLLTENNSAPLIASVTVFLNNGNGAFRSQLVFNLPASEYAVGVTVADFNRDGAPDIAVIGEALAGFGPPPPVAGHVYIALGKGDSSFAAPLSVANLAQTPNFIAAADFNHDDIPDLAVDAGTTLIFLGNGDGSVRSAPSVNLGHVNPGWIVVGDWTGSGNQGLGIADDATPAGIGIVEGNGDGTFHSAGKAAVDYFAGSVSAYASADLNGDGLPDLVVASAGNRISIFLDAGASPPLTFVPESAADLMTSVAPASLATIYGSFPFSLAQSGGGALPTQLGGVTVNVLDSAGITRPAPLDYVGPTQINLEIPPGTATGLAALTIEGGGAPLTGSALVRNVVPAIFTEVDVAFQGGRYPAAYAITYDAAGQAQPSILVASCETVPVPNCNVTPIPRPAGSRVFLELFATGIRNHLTPVVATLRYGASGLGGPSPINLAASYAGPQLQFDGLDQVNLEITNLPTPPPTPGAPPGTMYSLVLNVDGFVSNAVAFAVQ